ncbi:MAG: DNA gyrase C-terminal beta-propeller domain-containing protein, partial [Candidatus Gracilibacteria bacterium]|nr:DNA gyrase C-terminal beta-propeller domain-containing protein [Candidatus Gracilibacteria bacterium]
ARIVFADELKASDVIMISRKGQVVRIPLSSFKKLGRATQGVIVMRLKAGDRISSLEVLTKEKEEVALIEENTTPEALPLIKEQVKVEQEIAPKVVKPILKKETQVVQKKEPVKPSKKTDTGFSKQKVAKKNSAGFQKKGIKKGGILNYKFGM